MSEIPALEWGTWMRIESLLTAQRVFSTNTNLLGDFTEEFIISSPIMELKSSLLCSLKTAIAPYHSHLHPVHFPATYFCKI
jgi:hypothetical protein